MSENTPSPETVAIARVAERFKLDEGVVSRALKLLQEGLPVPYLARYRRDDVGGLDEPTLRDIRGMAERIIEMERRREFIMRAVSEHPEVTDKMRRRIERCRHRLELEYLYEPYRPPRKTPGTVARERGLGPIAESLLKNEEPDAASFVNPENGVADADQALAGARDILAERFGVDPEVRGAMLRAMEKEGSISAAPAHGKTAIPDRYGQFKTYDEKLSRVPPHRYLALCRAETEGALSIKITFPEEKVQATIEQRFYPHEVAEGPKAQLDLAAAEAIRLLRPAIADDALRDTKERADAASIVVFSNNLADLLLYPPSGPRRVMGVDPAPRGAIPVACVDERGQHLEHVRLKFFDKDEKKAQASRETIQRLFTAHEIEMIALGNGQGRRQCEEFLITCFEQLGGDELPPIIVVNEVGVGSYASGPVGRSELPALPVPARSAVSLARRLMDPLRELVKVDPKLLTVGQYQSDVDPQRLGRALKEVVEHCVCWVGVDVNQAPIQQIACVGGLTNSAARALVEHREKHGPFPTLTSLKDLHFVSDRAFELAAGFLRIGVDESLDATGVHPAHGEIVERIARGLGVEPADLIRNSDLLHDVVAEEFADENFSPATVAGVLFELAEAGVDPRAQLEVISRPVGVRTATDLQEGMRLAGRVTNVTNFGAFVDIGVQQDGLVHVSELADRFVKDPTSVVHVGQRVQVRVLGVDSGTGRISLSMKSGRAPRREKGGPRRPRRDRGERRPRREDRPARDEEPAAPVPESPPQVEPEPATASETPVPADMTEEEFMKHKLEELRKRFG